MNKLDMQFEVVIVGCGPTGAALANALGKQGVSVAVVERNVGVLEIPRAVHIDGETMRIFQSMDLAAPLLKVLRPGGSMHWVNAAGETLLVREGVQGLGQHGWHNDYYYHQPQLEEVLREGMKRYSTVRLMEGVELADLKQDEEGVELGLNELSSGQKRVIRCQYVVGCDGARSKVRHWVGGENFEDLGEHQAWLVVDAVLKRPLNLPEHSVQFCDPARPGTAVYVHPLRRRWELMLLPSEDPKEMTREARVWQMLEKWIKPTQGYLERAATYVFHSLVAHEWQKGRLLLAGDAVHQTPPFLGQGLCAAIRDVGNLAWKLGFALRHPGSADKVLASYGPERKPHARAFVSLAVEVGKVIQVLDPEQAKQRDAKLLKEGMRFKFPSPSLGEGLHCSPDEQSCVGKVIPQFETPSGEWTDELTAGQASLLMTADMVAIVTQAQRERMKALGVVPLDQVGTQATEWLAAAGAVAVLVRPDNYVFNAIANPSELDAALDGWASALGL
jgi:3-(3-hydroxy-phenyl)propionate hydroxylase